MKKISKIFLSVQPPNVFLYGFGGQEGGVCGIIGKIGALSIYASKGGPMSEKSCFTPHRSRIRIPENGERRALLKAVGFTESDLEKPLIGIANSWNEIVPGHYHLRQVSEAVKRGIHAAGGRAVEFGVIGACDGISQGKGMTAVLPTREIIAGSIELMALAHDMDGLVMLGSCDKIIPGMLLAAARLNIPTVILPGGPMLGGDVYGKRQAETTVLAEAVAKVSGKGTEGPDILTLKAIRNGILFVHATGGSTNTILHLTALAHELNIPAKTIAAIFEELGKTTPQIALVYPNSDWLMEDFYKSGGAPQVLKELREFLDLDCMTVDGRFLGEVIAAYRPKRPINRNLIRTAANPWSVGKGLAILYGNLAPEGCVTKPSAIAPEVNYFEGSAKVFHSEEEAAEAILRGEIQAGHVVVIRYEGPKGGPGMREMFTPMKYLHGLGLEKSTAVITDGRFSGTNNGCFVGHISPEAAEGGPLAAVRDGDRITIDIPARNLHLHVEEEELQKRLREVKPPEVKVTKGYLGFYARHAKSASEGGILL
jgi:dihydroxyacid dehydratase/phosphogluconate dehydratase